MDNAKDKINISVWGACPSRDSVVFDNFNVVRYAGFSSPYTMFSGTPVDISEEMRKVYRPEFGMRCMCLDANKKMDEYFKEVTSDWLLFDAICMRYDIFFWRDRNILISKTSYTAPKLNFLEKLFGVSQTIDVFDIPFDEIKKRTEQMCDRVLKIYRPEQIIFNELYACDDYVSRDGHLMSFPEDVVQKVVKRNALLKNVYDICIRKFAGCHVIKMPEWVFGDEMHRWGLYTFHYFGPYYEYSSRVIEIISKKLSVEEEEGQLTELCSDFSKKFAAWRKQLELGENSEVLSVRRECFDRFPIAEQYKKHTEIDLFGSMSRKIAICNKYSVTNSFKAPSPEEISRGSVLPAVRHRAYMLLLDVADIAQNARDAEEAAACAAVVCDEILRYYSRGDIILNEFYKATQYVAKDGTFRMFPADVLTECEQFNAKLKAANDVCESKLSGCHIIKMPAHTIAAENAEGGLSPLAFSSHYYDYVNKCIIDISNPLSERERERRLSGWFELYTERMNSEELHARMRGYRSQRERFKAEVESLNGKNDELLAQKSSLKAELEAKRAEIAALNENSVRLQREAAEFEGRLSEAEGRAAAAEERNGKLVAELSAQNKKLADEISAHRAVQAELSGVLVSRSYKLGRAVTFLPRKLRDALKGKR